MGILEDINEKLDRLLAAQASPPATVVAAAPPAAVDPLGLGAAAPAAPVTVTVTADMITELIQPHLDNEAVKTALGAAMRAQGIDALPNTPPEKYASLYAAFQAIIASGGAAAAAAAGNSII